MNPTSKTVVGIDVGGRKKGFHVVALSLGKLEPHHFTKAAAVADWCQARAAQVIAIDAPCAWAISGGSRFAERSLMVGGSKIQCFKTPTRTYASGRTFYEWVFNGEKLYQQLRYQLDYSLFNGVNHRGKILFETFPHAVVCALAGRLVPAQPKAITRRRMLRDHGYDDSLLKNLDFVDAALCALSAERFLLGRAHYFGNAEEGFIVVPS